MARLVIIMVFIAMSSSKPAAGIEIEGGQRNKSELRSNKGKQEENNIAQHNKHIKDSKSNIQSKNENLHLSGFDIPLDAFSLHHPFLQPHVQEFEFSDWYFLFFTLFYKNVSASPAATADVSVLVPELAKALSSKLSVPANIFTISKAEKYRTNSISANLSVSNHTVPHLHHKLTNLHNLAPLFWLSGVRYKLVQVIHDKNQHLFVRNDGKHFSNKEVGLLIIVTLGGIIIFLVMVMLALLNVKLFFMRDQSRDLDSILKDDHCEDLLELDPDEGAIFTIEGKHQDQELGVRLLSPEAEEEEANQPRLHASFIKKLKYCKTLF